MQRDRDHRPSEYVDPDAAPAAAFVLEERYPGSEGPWHEHRRAQLVHAAEGVITVLTARGRWVTPPERAVWVPGKMRHAVVSRKPFRLLTLYLRADDAPVPAECRVVAVSPLVAELLAAAAKFGPAYPTGRADERLLQVLVDRLSSLDVAPLLHLAQPTDPALARITEALSNDPSDARTLDAWCAEVGLVPRTAARRFLAETGLTFGRWRQQLRLLAAIERLGDGQSVTRVAFEVGYADVSSFIAAFKSAMGTTPAKYFAAGSDLL